MDERGSEASSDTQVPRMLPTALQQIRAGLHDAEHEIKGRGSEYVHMCNWRQCAGCQLAVELIMSMRTKW